MWLTVYAVKRILLPVSIPATNLFASLAHLTRLRCLVLLLSENELCVCELTHATGAAQPNMSRHLAQLREVGLVVDRREGLWIYYRLNPELPDWVRGALRETVQGVAGEEPFVGDAAVLAAMPNRSGAPRCA